MRRITNVRNKGEEIDWEREQKEIRTTMQELVWIYHHLRKENKENRTVAKGDDRNIGTKNQPIEPVNTLDRAHEQLFQPRTENETEEEYAARVAAQQRHMKLNQQ